MKGCQNDLHITFNLVELVLREGHLGHNTHTQMHSSTYL